VRFPEIDVVGHPRDGTRLRRPPPTRVPPPAQIAGAVFPGTVPDMSDLVLPADTYCAAAPGHEWHGPYHDTEYGFPVADESALFERLVLEINQAGLSWLTILKKREGFRDAYDQFDVDTVAGYGPDDRTRLLDDAGIIRNRLKVDAAISNAAVIAGLRGTDGGFDGWLAANHPLDKADWVKLFKRTFRFTGGEITGEFLMSTGWIAGAHHPACPVYAEIAALSPPWMQT
jgi:DNA-3-methyladenine glycosylase I